MSLSDFSRLSTSAFLPCIEAKNPATIPALLQVMLQVYSTRTACCLQELMLPCTISWQRFFSLTRFLPCQILLKGA
jgi:hypothetical protein